ncbi:hypothetical protein M2133_001671 [Parabacteroides sp. PF5-6]|nr:hypothetical protein [Parabacteroides sp. PF5-6]
MNCYSKGIKYFFDANLKSENILIIGSYRFNSLLEKELSYYDMKGMKSINMPSETICSLDALSAPYLLYVDENCNILKCYVFFKNSNILLEYFIESLNLNT